LYVCIFAADVKLHSRHGDVKENAVVDLAESSAVVGGVECIVSFGCSDSSAGEGHPSLPSTALLDLGDVELQKAVEPLHEFLPVDGFGVSCLVIVGRVVIAGPAVGDTNRDSPILTIGYVWNCK